MDTVIQESGQRLECDGCNRLMTFANYRDHDCLAYVNSQHKNPLEHKMSASQWKVPGARGRLQAAGSVVTNDPAVIRRQRGLFARLVRWLRHG